MKPMSFKAFPEQFPYCKLPVILHREQIWVHIQAVLDQGPIEDADAWQVIVTTSSP